MTNPKDPWGQRPEDAPTEHLAAPGRSGFESAHTTEYAEAYGQPAPSMYPTVEQFSGWTAPPPEATRVLPTHESQWGANPTGYGEPLGVANAPTVAPEPPRKRNTGLWVALGLGVVLLVGVIGLVVGMTLGGGNGSTPAAAPLTSAPRQPAPSAPRQAVPPPSVSPGLPGLGGGLELSGTTMGTISNNAGGTLTVNSLIGPAVTVRTDDKTSVVSATAARAKDLKVGDVVVVQGDKAADGSILARVIISTSLTGEPK
ncbi:hypothetical protein D5S18_10835 [Nocardia panacis]|uniref:DUF5666 domain-containing protein n=1 Tax=Nocardia panacis TaxID=2340916 RepID=A0A3A4KTC3_9NOCA|nr:DUF5666 domain-containing protein [Nocardia panacis]RJO76746.1 hypothetical protein D5S18_10835 [Nocardia panacis]